MNWLHSLVLKNDGAEARTSASDGKARRDHYSLVVLLIYF